MKVTVLQEDLSKALSIASRFTSPKVQLPVLANVLLSASKNVLKICATNLEISICVSIGAEIEEEGEITLPARTVTDIVINLQKGKITLENKNDTLLLSARGFSSKLTGMSASDFPSVPQGVGKKSFTLSAKDVASALSLVLPSVSVDESRPILTGVLVIFSEGKLQFVATDGFRLSRKELSVEGISDDAKIIVPKGILLELLRLKDESENIELSYTKEENQLVCQIGKAIVSSRLIDGEFPDFERIIPKITTMSIHVGKADFLRAVKIASIFARDSANVVKFAVGESVLTVSAESPAKGTQSTEVEAEVTTKNDDTAVIPVKAETQTNKFVIAFNCKFLEDYLNVIEGEEVTIECVDQSTACIFKDASLSNFLHIIMPIRLQN